MFRLVGRLPHLIPELLEFWVVLLIGHGFTSDAAVGPRSTVFPYGAGLQTLPITVVFI